MTKQTTETLPEKMEIEENINEHTYTPGPNAVDISPEQDQGVLKEIIKPGIGEESPSSGSKVFVRYTGKLEDGTIFDSHHNKDAFGFTLGKGKVIKALDIGVATMKKDEKCILVCKSFEYACGADGSLPKIPPSATLVFEVELLQWQLENLSPDKASGVPESILQAGEGHIKPNDDSTVEGMAKAGTMTPRVIQADEFVIIKTGKTLHLTQVFKDRPIYISKQKINMRSAIGRPYGSTFGIRRNEIIYLEPKELKTAGSGLISTDDADQKDNRSIVDDGKSQKLTKDDIEDFKAKGITGKEIVEILVENSSTFKEKSAFAQEKYIKKKKDKYLGLLQIFSPNTRLLAQSYYSHNPVKICNMRMDTLSQMLSYCNVMSGVKCIVLDGIQGLLAAAVLERLGEEGCVVHIYPESTPTSTYRHAINALNFPKTYLKKMVFSIKFEDAISLRDVDQELGNDSDKTNGNQGTSDSILIQSGITEGLQKFERRVERKEMESNAKRILLGKDMDCLLVASKYSPLNALHLLDFMANSRPFAVQSISQDPLLQCYLSLKAKGNAINMNIVEPFLRSYQVLPERTHPYVTESATGGYLLTGIKVR